MDTQTARHSRLPAVQGPACSTRRRSSCWCAAPIGSLIPIRDGIPVMLEDEARALEPMDPLLQD